MCEFKAFDIVECIDDTPVHKQSRTMPASGHLYRVQSVRPVGDGYSIRLLELAPDCYAGGPCSCGNCGWDGARFRLIHRPDKLALFHAMLDDREQHEAPVSEPVD